MIETDDNESYEVFLGKAFLELAEVSGGYYYSNEKKLGTGFVNEVLLTPRFVYVWMNGSAAFPSDLLSSFLEKYAGRFSPEYQLTIDNFQCVVDADEVISKYGLDKLHGKDGGSLKEGDVLVRIELKRKFPEEEIEADTIKKLFCGIKEALKSSECGDISFALYDVPAGICYDFVFFSKNTHRLKSLYDEIKKSSLSKQWEIKSPNPVKMQQSGNVHACTYRFCNC